MEGDNSAAELTRVRLESRNVSPVAPRKTREKRRNVNVDDDDDDDDDDGDDNDDNDDDNNTAAAAAGGRFSVQLHGLKTRRKLIVHHACT